MTQINTQINTIQVNQRAPNGMKKGNIHLIERRKVLAQITKAHAERRRRADEGGENNL